MLRIELEPSGYLLIQKHLGLGTTPIQLEHINSSVKTRIYHAQKKAKYSRNLFKEKVEEAKKCQIPLNNPEENDEQGYIPGGCEVPGPLGLEMLSNVQVFEG